MDFDTQCKALCKFCHDDAPLRQRADTGEFVHDMSVEIPGTLGKRMGHVLCQANTFRLEWMGKVE